MYANGPANLQCQFEQCESGTLCILQAQLGCKFPSCFSLGWLPSVAGLVSRDLNLDTCASKERLNKISPSMATLRYSHLWNIFTPTGKLLLWVIFCSLRDFCKFRALWPSQRDKKKWYQILAGTAHHEIKMHWRQICRKTVISIYLPNIFQWFLYYLVFKGSLPLNSDTFLFFFFPITTSVNS